MIEVRIRVGNKVFVGEEVDCFEVGQEALLVGGSNSTGSDVGDRNTCPRMCGSSPSGSRRRFGQAVEQQVERDAHLEPRQMHAEADVDAVAPADVGLRPPEDVEAVRIRVALVLAGWPHRASASPTSPPGSAPRRARCLGVATRVIISSGASHRTASSIACGMQRPIGADRVELIRIGEQPEQQVAQRAVRGLDAGRKQQPQEREDLLVRELLTVDLGLREAADQVVARLLPPGRENRGEVVPQRLRGRDGRAPG